MKQTFNFIRDILQQHHLDAIAFVPGANFRRIFNHEFFLMERPLVIIIPATGQPVAIVPFLEMPDFETLDFEGPVFSWQDHHGYEDAFAAAGKALPQLNESQAFGIEALNMRAFEHMALARAFPQAAFIDAHHALSQIRLCKTNDEIAALKEAIKISENALEHTLKSVQIGQTEAEIKSTLMRNLYAMGAQAQAFDPIVAANSNSARPHASARTDYALQKGDALMFDFGARYDGYNADITRTFFVQEASDFHQNFYNTVLKANQKGREVSKPGISAHDVNAHTKAVLEQSEFADYIVHKTGHGLGLEVHEAPHIMHGNHELLQQGMVITIEPGLYRPDDCGVRIEDDLVLTTTGNECLTQFSRELRVIG